MHSIEISKLQAVTAPRALSDSDRLTAKPADATRSLADGSPSSGTAPTGVSLEVSGSLDTSAVPVNQDRVAEIKSALEDGSYPLVPAEIADAIIAAQVSFGLEQ